MTDVSLQDPKGQPVAEAPSGSEAPLSQDDIAFAAFEAEQQRRASEKVVQEQGEQPKVIETKEAPTQPTEKDTRHFSRKINEEIDKRVVLAEAFLEKDSDYIYTLAERDPDTADRILKRKPEYGAESSADLLAKKDSDEASLEEVKARQTDNDRNLAKIQEELRSERIDRLKEKNPDLQGDLEDKFRELYSNDTFKEYKTDEVLRVARALLGKESPDTSTNDVALAILRASEGTIPSLRGGHTEAKDLETSEQRRLRTAFGHSKDDEKLLPPGWEQLIQ